MSNSDSTKNWDHGPGAPSRSIDLLSTTIYILVQECVSSVWQSIKARKISGNQTYTDFYQYDNWSQDGQSLIRVSTVLTLVLISELFAFFKYWTRYYKQILMKQHTSYYLSFCFGCLNLFSVPLRTRMWLASETLNFTGKCI